MLMELTPIVLGGAMTFGPVVVFLVLLNLRDRRTSQLRDAALRQLPLRELHGLVSIRVRAGVLTRHSALRLEMVPCTCDQIWGAVLRLSRTFPPHVRLTVAGAADPRLTTTLTMETRGTRELGHSPEPEGFPG